MDDSTMVSGIIVWGIISAFYTLRGIFKDVKLVWKNRKKIYNKKERINAFTSLGVVFGGAFMAVLFGSAFFVLSFNAITGNNVGLEQVLGVFHGPLVFVVTFVAGLIGAAGVLIVHNCSIEIKKAIMDPSYKI